MKVTPVQPTTMSRGLPLFDRHRSKLNKQIQVTWVDTGKTEVMFEKDFYDHFGRKEGNEVLQGFLPNIIAVRL